MTAWLAVLAVASTPGITRDLYGVPQVRGESIAVAMRLAGRAVAEDRLWQMENSRRLARGRIAELVGQGGVASDTSQFKTGYTDAELTAQLRSLSPSTQLIFESYAAGVNDAIEAMKKSGTLPAGYAANGLAVEPWTALDSAFISVRLARMFGAGGEGELRNVLLYQYLKGQKSGSRVEDVLDDFAWFNDPASPSTVSLEDDPLRRSHLKFSAPSRAVTQAHLASLPPTNLFELAPAVTMASLEDTRLVAEANGVFSKTGSYAIVVHPSRSVEKQPMLLGGPQMGHQIPSVVHEISIQAPGFRVSGMNVPGIPGVLIGSTPDLAWTFTSGVADLTDIFFNPRVDEDHYMVGTSKRRFDRATRVIKVKGGNPVTVERLKTHLGPVVLDSKLGKAVYSKADGYQKNELKGMEFVYNLMTVKTAKSALEASKASPVSFNFFFATRSGDIGYRYCGNVPIRSEKIDPRFPAPGTPEFGWKGMIPQDKMPYVLNPKSGLLTNWNNKPAAWWPNWDTPVWGRHFRVAALRNNLPDRTLSSGDLRQAIFNIARQDEGSWQAFMKVIRPALTKAALEPLEKKAAAELSAWKGERVNGSAGALLYEGTLAELRQELIVPHTGNFISAANLNRIAQTSVLSNALMGETKFSYLAGRTADEVVVEAFKRVVKNLSARGDDPTKWGLSLGGIRVPSGDPIPYTDRGTYIQLIQFSPGGWRGSSVITPGVAESGAHSADQVPLARNWEFKAMWRP